ncbi:hypothetical protein [Halobaculum gomorrense]|nr:hypothetical protein [Halobaculum gomorrense]
MTDEDEYSLYARVVKPDLVLEAVFGIAESPAPMDPDSLQEFIDREERYTDAVIHLAKELNMAREAPAGLVVDPEIEDEIKRASPDQRFVILNRYVQRYEPFTTFSSFINKGYSAEAAARKVNSLYQMNIADSKLKSQLLNLGEYAEIISVGDEPRVTGIGEDPLSEKYVEDLLTALQSEMSARLFLEDRLGEDLVRYLDHGSFEELIAALRLFEDEPRSAIAAAGRAVEDFQRDLAADYGSEDRDYQSASGIGQLTMHLNGDDLMMKRHLHGGNYLGGMRNPSGGHGKDTETLERWDVSSEVALEYVLAATHYIRSQYRYTTELKQIL